MSDRKRIIFVDDEEKVIRSYQRALMDQDEVWDMSFVQSAEEGLAAFERSPFDVIVTDIRMPGMDGITLLKEIRKRWPNAIRIIISGQFDEKLVLNSIDLAHQYLFKPCDPDAIIKVIYDSCSIRNIIADENLQQIVSGMDTIPSLPSLYNQIVKAVADPNISMPEIGKIISRDIGMTAKVLQLVNSAFFSLRRKINSPEEAVVYIGLETVKAMVLSAQVFSEMATRGLPADYLDDLWAHSFMTAGCARAIARLETRDKLMIDNAFTAGIMHDVGKLILLVNMKDRYIEYLARLDTGETDQLALERELFGTTHPEIGGYLLSLWGLPDVIIRPLVLHHDPARSNDVRFAELTAVHVADIFAHQLTGRKPRKGVRVDGDYLRAIKAASHLEEWRSACQSSMTEKGTA